MADVTDELEARIATALPGARVHASAHGGGHFSIEVKSALFAGKGTLARHRLVLSAIAPLMAGEGAPVHAVDKLVTEE